jgi:beta-lactamase class A
MVAQVPGKVAIACHHLATGERWALNDGVLSAASLVKVPLAIAAYQAVARGELALLERVRIPAVAGDDEAEFDNLGHAPAQAFSTWRKVIDRMLTESDNAATNALIERLGLGALEGLTAELGLSSTALRRVMLDVAAREAGRDNTTSATDMATLLAALVRGELLSPAHTAELLGVLGQQRDLDKLASGLPAEAVYAGKTGELPGWRHDAAIIDGAWVVAVLAEGGPEVDTLIGRVGSVLYAHFQEGARAHARAAAWLAAEKASLIPDPRLEWDTLAVGWQDGTLVVTGETTVPARLSVPASLGVRVAGRALTPRLGVVTVPCLQLRRGPGHAHELVSQLRLGDPLHILDAGPDWTLLRAPDGYVAYGKTNNLTASDTWRPAYVVAAPIALAQAEDGRIFQLSAGACLAEGRGDGHFRLPTGEGIHVTEDLVVPLGEILDTETLLRLASRFLGLPYLWGGTTGWGIDCSGLVQLTHFVCGVGLPRDADQQQDALPPVSAIADLAPGDLVFFPGHVGIHLGRGEFIHASAQAGMVTLNSFDAASPRFDPWLFENFSGGGRSPLPAPVESR